jgi:ribosomal protein L35
MPKQKSRNSITKRFRVTKNGKVLARQAFRRHLKEAKSKSQLKRLKRVKEIVGHYAKKLKKVLGRV